MFGPTEDYSDEVAVETAKVVDIEETHWIEHVAGRKVEIYYTNKDYRGLYVFIVEVEDEAFLFMSANGRGATSQKLER